MYNYWEWAKEAAYENIISFADASEECKIAFLTLASDYMAECEPHTYSDSPYHDEETGEFSDADFICHMWDLFRWHDGAEAREYWNIPENIEGLEFWRQAYDAANEHNSFVYSDNKSIIAWLDC